jgi:hypothetical protein
MKVERFIAGEKVSSDHPEVVKMNMMSASISIVNKCARSIRDEVWESGSNKIKEKDLAILLKNEYSFLDDDTMMNVLNMVFQYHGIEII